MRVPRHRRVLVGSPMTEKQPAQKGAGFLEMEDVALLLRAMKLIKGVFPSCGTKEYKSYRIFIVAWTL